MKNKEFIIPNLNTYSNYSLLSSGLGLNTIINFAINNKQKYVALTDTNLYGAFEFYKLAKKNNIKPIIGLDVNYENNHFLIYAKNFDGFKNIIKISSFIMTKKDFEINEYLDNTFIVNLKGSDFNTTKANVYTIEQDCENRIAINEARYLVEEDRKMLDVLYCVHNNLNLNIESYESNFFNKNISLLKQEDFEKQFDDKSLENLINEIKDIELIINPLENNFIEYKNSFNLSSKAYLEKLCNIGLNDKINQNFISQKDRQKYEERMNYELNIIDKMGFNDYFLVIQDFIMEAKNRNILIGPGRGSAAGSLVAYLLGITNVDSIKYDLIFERFLNPGRISMPDIDTDIMDSRRQEIIDYMFEKYGYDNVAHIITFQRMKAKMAIRDVGRVLSIPLSTINRIAKEFPSELEDEFDKYIDNNKVLLVEKNNYPDLFEITKKLIGFPRQTGIHAAGIVLSKTKLTDIVPIQLGVNNEIVTQYSMEFLEELGLIKMDLLGLTNLTTISNILTLIKMRYKLEIDLYKINLEDQKVFADISNGYTLGIFQLESPGMRSLIKQMKPKNIEDISLCSALFRPGPQQNIKTFIARRDKKEEISYIDEKCIDILKDTNGIIVYQEQVIALVQKVANFSASEADIFRRIISKKDDSQLEKFKVRFFEEALKNGYQQDKLESIYEYIYTFANYGFNHSHSIAYSLIGYWLSYLKHYYPTEFMAVLMTSFEGNHEKIRSYVAEAQRMKINIESPHINYSLKNFRLSSNGIIFGFGSIKGIGNEKAKKILEARDSLKDKKFTDFKEALKVLLDFKIGNNIIELLIYAGAFDSFKISRKELLNKLNKSSNDSVWGFDIEEENDETNLLIDSETIKDKMIDLIGVYFPDVNDKDNDSLKGDDNNEIVSKYDIKTLDEIDESTTSFISYLTIKSIRFTKTKTNKDMFFVKVIDQKNNTADIACFASAMFDKEKDYKNVKIVAEIKNGNRGKQLISIKEWL